MDRSRERETFSAVKAMRQRPRCACGNRIEDRQYICCAACLAKPDPRGSVRQSLGLPRATDSDYEAI